MVLEMIQGYSTFTVRIVTANPTQVIHFLLKRDSAPRDHNARPTDPNAETRRCPTQKVSGKPLLSLAGDPPSDTQMKCKCLRVFPVRPTLRASADPRSSSLPTHEAHRG